jgi:hypothetical protein
MMMTTMLTGNAARGSNTVSSPSAGRAIEVVIMPDVPFIVFVVDDDVSVRESLELLVSTAGWRPETFASAQEFLSRPQRSRAAAAARRAGGPADHLHHRPRATCR